MSCKSEEFKTKVVQKYLKIEDKKGALLQISKYYKVNISTLKLWINKFKTEGKIINLPTHGRKSHFSPNVEKKLQNILNKPIPMTSKIIQHKMGKLGHEISNRTLRRYLTLANAEFKSVQKIPLLTEEHIQKRFLFSAKMKDSNYKNIIFSDECTFQTYSAIKKAWMLKNDQKQAISPTHPQKIHVWGCFSSLGFGSLFIFENNLNSQILIKIYKNHLLKSAQEWFGPNPNTWWLLEDNDPKHTSKMATKYRLENKIQKLDFPPYSPDLNPIENIWGIMKNIISQNQITSTIMLKKKINQIWKEFDPSLALKLSKKFNSQTHMVFLNKGKFK
jgi:transposase